ncbi:hypothetical protein TPY_0585 [Sulfobacillus acidophilus TPY]|uniref:Spore germination protein n=1 Tax=Sulfobacillus acidophilus (strain ATCC 700253 / DSM 10332 / NAL) TaxID=679936 RepID=G8U0W5_SULAD|nr:hypothetical protein TPY_0585 [Sulfobacillus acidophilus TPY]AEW06510.1 Spore germination protein [Sulfobacillus acidophilus DSM 10332]
MTGPVEPISKGQFFMMVAVSVVAGGVYLWPQYLVASAGSNGLYALPVTTGIALLLTWLEVRWAETTHASPFLLTVRRTWGWFSWPVFLGTAVFCVAIDVIILALFGKMLQTFYYPNTPSWAILAVIGVTVAWVGARPLATVARQVQFWFPLILITLLLVLALSISHWRFYQVLLPSPNWNIPDWFRAVVGTWFLYVNGGVVVSLTPRVRVKHARERMQMALWGIGFQGFILLVLYVVVMTTLGPYGTAKLRWPIIYVFSLISVRSFFIKGIGLLVTVIWTSALILYLAVHLFCLGWNVDTLFRQKNYRWMIVTATAVIAGLAAFIPSDLVARALLFNWVNPADFYWTLTVIPVSVAVAWFRQRHRGQSTAGEGGNT